MSEWITCSERLPKNCQSIICTGFIYNKQENGRWVEPAIFEDQKFYPYTTDNDGEIATNYDVIMHPPTHWMPLPEPPK